MNFGGSSRGNQAHDLESQNDAALDDLHQKIRSMRSVTNDIYNDSMGQNSLLGNTDHAFDSFKASLLNSTNRLSTTVAAQSSQTKTIMYIVGAVLLLVILYKLFV